MYLSSDTHSHTKTKAKNKNSSVKRKKKILYHFFLIPKAFHLHLSMFLIQISLEEKKLILFQDKHILFEVGLQGVGSAVQR